MSRLLLREDFEFLRQQEGYSRSLERSLRSSRILVFRSYLSEIRADFNRLQVIGKSMAIAGVAGPEIMNQLFEEKLRFEKAYWAIRLKLVIAPFAPVDVDASRLVESFRVSASAFEIAFQAN